MTKNIVLLLFLCFSQFSRANMSSPIEEGTLASSAFSSKDIDILSETISIKIDKEFRTAKFTVEYTIKSDIIGKQIPLLFYAQDYKDSFGIWFDNQKIEVKDIPEKYLNVNKSPFSAFSRCFEKSRNNEPEEVSIYWHENSGIVYSINDLKYFDTEIKQGRHKIRVVYIANVWINNSDWIKEYSFRYSLTPAKFWKSFGKLSITVEQEGVIRQIKSNLGQPLGKGNKANNSWEFNKLPAEYFDFTYIPTPTSNAKLFMSIEPFGITILIGLLLTILHLSLVIWYRKRFINKKYSIIVIFGSLIIPLLILISYIYSFDLIDYFIGEEAGGNHGYPFLIIVFYPVLMPIYWLIVWVFDRQSRHRMINNKQSDPI
jgi:hypothetical protein